MYNVCVLLVFESLRSLKILRVFIPQFIKLNEIV